MLRFLKNLLLVFLLSISFLFLNNLKPVLDSKAQAVVDKMSENFADHAYDLLFNFIKKNGQKVIEKAQALDFLILQKNQLVFKIDILFSAFFNDGESKKFVKYDLVRLDNPEGFGERLRSAGNISKFIYQEIEEFLNKNNYLNNLLKEKDEELKSLLNVLTLDYLENLVIRKSNEGLFHKVRRYAANSLHFVNGTLTAAVLGFESYLLFHIIYKYGINSVDKDWVVRAARWFGIAKALKLEPLILIAGLPYVGLKLSKELEEFVRPKDIKAK